MKKRFAYLFLFTFLVNALALQATTRSYEHGIFWAPPLSEGADASVIFHEVKVGSGKDGEICLRTPHAIEGNKSYCFSKSRVDELAQFKPTQYVTLQNVIVDPRDAWAVAKGFLRHTIFTQIALLVANLLDGDLPLYLRPAGMNPRLMITQGAVGWSAHIVGSCLSVLYLAYTGEIKFHMNWDSAFLSPGEIEKLAQQNQLAYFLMDPFRYVIQNGSPDTEPSKELLGNMRGGLLDGNEDAVLLIKSSGRGRAWASTLRRLTADQELTLKSQPIDPKIFLDAKQNEFRSFEVCFREKCSAALFWVSQGGVQFQIGSERTKYYSWNEINQIFNMDAEQAISDRQARLDALQGSLPVKMLWKNPKAYLTFYPTVRVISETLALAVVLGGGIYAAGLHPLFGMGNILYITLLSAFGPQVLPYIDRYFDFKEPPAFNPENQPTRLHDELLSYFLSNPPQMGRRYILLS